MNDQKTAKAIVDGLDLTDTFYVASMHEIDVLGLDDGTEVWMRNGDTTVYSTVPGEQSTELRLRIGSLATIKAIHHGWKPNYS